MTESSLTEIRDQTFNAPVDVDDTRFVNCRFLSVQLRYGGGALPHFEDCTFDNVGWYFHDAALRTVQLIQMQNYDGEGQSFIDDLFRPGHVIGE
jgi:hypothetical protein